MTHSTRRLYPLSPWEGVVSPAAVAADIRRGSFPTSSKSAWAIPQYGETLQSTARLLLICQRTGARLLHATRQVVSIWLPSPLFPTPPDTPPLYRCARISFTALTAREVKMGCLLSICRGGKAAEPEQDDPESNVAPTQAPERDTADVPPPLPDDVASYMQTEDERHPQLDLIQLQDLKRTESISLRSQPSHPPSSTKSTCSTKGGEVGARSA
ncbi:hypothetical protein NMY22_g17818 [Coprinellus aureogranulatus]|nr:hypothetical protein NMY22_g17818 [Coprinellus aureogranulatus]